MLKPLTMMMTLHPVLKSLLLITCLLVALLGCTKSNSDNNPAPANGNFTITDVAISTTTAQIIDPEFDYNGNRMCWQDLSRNLWVCDVNPTTGEITPNTGRGTLIDTDLAPIDITWNGPEWAFSTTESQIVYTKAVSGVPTIWRARLVNGTWVKENLATPGGRFNPRATKNKTDATPYVYYFSSQGQNQGVYIRPLTSGGSETNVPGTTDAHWVDGDNVSPSMTLIRTSDKQVMLLDVATQSLTQLTFDGGEKQRPYMWRAPDFNNELLFFARVDKSIRVYRKVGNNWTVINTLNSPAVSSGGNDYSFIASPEPFVYQGKSYISFMASGSILETDGLPAQIWFMAVNPATPLSRRISDDRVVSRSDPEPYFTNSLAYIYYTDIVLNGSALNTASQLVLRRGNTGLN